MPIDHDSGSPAKRAGDRERKLRKEIKECENIIESTIIKRMRLQHELNKMFSNN